MRCIICDSVDKWKSVDEYRLEPKGMSLCTDCGFVSYPSLYKTEEEIKEFYRNDYRNPPSVNNIFTCQRKMHYHIKFLLPELERWQALEDKSQLSIGEVGSAFGFVLGWFKNQFKGCTLKGTELTTSFRRNAKHMYDIDLDEDLDLTHKYDMIMSYKVAEHQMDIDKRLLEYKEALKPGGVLYVSVPTWWNSLENFGVGNFDLKYYYDPAHINVWTRKLFETLLRKTGFEVIREDHVMYGDTYLCKRNDELMKESPQYEDPAHIKGLLKKTKEACEAYEANDYEKACDIWPNFPVAQVGAYEKARKQWHEKGWEAIESELIPKLIEACPDDMQVQSLIADIYMRYSRFDKSIEHWVKVLDIRPESPHALMNIGQCYRNMSKAASDDKTRFHFLNEARKVTNHLKEVSMQHRDDATNWILADNAKLPTSSELKEMNL